jgi:hypothetical protein
MGIILIIIIGLAIFLHFYKKENLNDTIINIIEIILISLLINVFSSFFIIAFLDDKQKRKELVSKSALLKYIVENTKRLKRLFVNIYEDLIKGSKFETSEEIIAFLESLNGGNNPYLIVDFSKTCEHFHMMGGGRVIYGNWLGFIYKNISDVRTNISAFLSMYPLYLDANTTFKLLNLINKINFLLEWESHDVDVLQKYNYIIANKNMMVVNIIPELIDSILQLDEEIKEDFPHNQI